MSYVIIPGQGLSGTPTPRRVPADPRSARAARSRVGGLGGPLKLTIEHVGAYQEDYTGGRRYGHGGMFTSHLNTSDGMFANGRGKQSLAPMVGLSGLGAAAGPTAENVAREMYAARVGQAVADANTVLTQALNGQLALTSVALRNIFFVPNVENARNAMQRAQAQLNEQFLPIAIAAIRDYSRPLPEVTDSINGYLADLKEQIGLSLQIAHDATFEQALKDFGAKVPGLDVLPFWVAPAVGIFVIAYAVKAFT